MYYIGIDISKYKHDCFIATEAGEVINDNFSFTNNNEGFNQLLLILKSLDNSKEIRIGLEATGHYGINLRKFLEDHNYSYMEFNPFLVKKFISSTTLRRTKTDKVDSFIIYQYLSSVTYKPNPFQFYHNFTLKSLCRIRDSLIKQRSIYLVTITNILDLAFPEFKPFFNNKFSATSLFILNKYGLADKIKNMKDFDSIKNCARGRFSYTQFLKLKDLAKNTIGISDENLTFQLSIYLNLYKNLNDSIIEIENKIEIIIKELNPPTLSIPGIGLISCAGILSEYGDISNFKSPDAMVAFAGLEPSIIQSGTQEFKGRMVKRGSGHLRYLLMNLAGYVVLHNNTFADYYHKKRNEGKCHRVALSHVAKKLIRLIYCLETTQTFYDSLKIK